MSSQKGLLGVLVLFYLTVDYSAVATWQYQPPPPPQFNPWMYPQQPQFNPWMYPQQPQFNPWQYARPPPFSPWPNPQQPSGQLDLWALCPNLYSAAGKGRLSIQELNTVYNPTSNEILKTLANVATEMATLKLPRIISSDADMTAFWIRFNATDAKFAEQRRKLICYTTEQLYRINANGGQVDGASSLPGGTRLNITFAFTCSRMRITALQYLRGPSMTDSVITEATDAIQSAFEQDCRCYQNTIMEKIVVPLERFTFTNMDAATVKSTLEETVKSSQPIEFLNPVGVTLKMALAAAKAMSDLMNRP